MPKGSHPGFAGEMPTSAGFLFEVDNVEIGVFSEVSGLEMTVEVATYAEGGENAFVHQLPGRVSWPHIVLKGGITDNDALFQWVNRTSGPGAHKQLSRSTAAITALSASGQRLRSWSLTDAFAVRWSGPKFDASANSTLQEEIELAHHGFTSKNLPSNGSRS